MILHKTISFLAPIALIVGSCVILSGHEPSLADFGKSGAAKLFLGKVGIALP